MPVTVNIPESVIQAFPTQERDALRHLVDLISEAVDTSIGALTLNDLSDVIAPSPVLGDSIFWDNSDWVNDSPLTGVISSALTTYTAALTDNAKFIYFTSSSPITFEIPPQSSVSWEDNSQFEICQGGTGQVTIQGGSGVTVNKGSVFDPNTRSQYSVVGVKRISSDNWVLFGDLLVGS